MVVVLFLEQQILSDKFNGFIDGCGNNSQYIFVGGSQTMTHQQASQLASQPAAAIPEEDWLVDGVLHFTFIDSCRYLLSLNDEMLIIIQFTQIIIITNCRMPHSQ